MENREIKFRVWDRKKKRFDTCRNGSYGIEFSIDYKGIQTLSKRSFKIYQQSTGLFDKNGKEIFDGDIVKIKPIEHLYQIRFENAAFVLDDYETSPLCDHRDELEIVGNIYENKELIK